MYKKGAVDPTRSNNRGQRLKMATTEIFGHTKMRASLGKMHTLWRRDTPRVLNGLQHVRKWQDSYFFWLRLKTAGNSKRASEMLSSFTNFRVKDWVMLYSLVSRNVVARIRGKKFEKRLAELSRTPQSSGT